MEFRFWVFGTKPGKLQGIFIREPYVGRISKAGQPMAGQIRETDVVWITGSRQPNENFIGIIFIFILFKHKYNCWQLLKNVIWLNFVQEMILNANFAKFSYIPY